VTDANAAVIPVRAFAGMNSAGIWRLSVGSATAIVIPGRAGNAPRIGPLRPPDRVAAVTLPPR